MRVNAYLVIAYPKISQSSFDWIQNYRKENDSRFYSMVNPHFTIVFPISGLSKEDFSGEIKKQSKGLKNIDFELKIATINQDISGGYYHEFLVPDKGYSDIIRLHDKLYSGVLAEFMRMDIDFIPHISIGNADDAQESKKRVDALNRQKIEIEGFIETLDIIDYDGTSVRTIEKIIME